MMGIGTAGAAAPLGTALIRRASAQTATRTNARTFALIGDESHNSDVYGTAFQSTLVQDAVLPIDFSDEEELLSYKTLIRYRILIIFRNGTGHPGGYTNLRSSVVSVPPLQKESDRTFFAMVTDEQCKCIKRCIEKGSALWAWHSNSRLSPMRRDYRDVQGASIIGHLPIQPFKIKIINDNHPITKDVDDFIITDQQHFLAYERNPKYVLVVGANEDGLTYNVRDGKSSTTCEAVWAYDYGRGRVCMMIPATT